MLVAENVKALRKLLPVLEAEYGKAGYKCHAQLFNSKYWGVPQNRERYIGTERKRGKINGFYIFN